MKKKLLSVLLVTVITLSGSTLVCAAEMEETTLEVDMEEVSEDEETPIPDEMNKPEEQVQNLERAARAGTVSGTFDNGLKWELADGVLTISGNGALENSIPDEYKTEVTAVIIKNGVTEIGRGAFMYYAMKELVIENGVSKIEAWAFAYCGHLSEVIIPASVKSIAHWAFGRCDGLQTIYFKGDAPEVTLTDDPEFNKDGGPFQGRAATVYYPQGNETYTEEVKKAYGLNLSWIAEDVLKIIPEATNNVHVLGTSDTATIVCNGELKDFVSVFVDGNGVNGSDYILEEGSTILTFTAKYLNGLTVGKHSVTLNYTYASVDTDLTILSAEKPVNITNPINAENKTSTAAGRNGLKRTAAVQTGDNAVALPWLLAAVSAAVAGIGTVFIKRRHSV